MAKAKTKEAVTQARAARSHDEHEARKKANAPVEKAREVRKAHIDEATKAERQKQVDLLAEDDKADKKDKEKVTLHDGKPGSGAGLRPGQLHAPKSNPGAAARVPSQPLQPESLQSHGLGILYDKDLDNPPYDTGDPLETDEGPSGSNPGVVDKDAERKKAEKASPRFKQQDPDNPAIGAGGRKDATASPDPIGSRTKSKNSVAGGSNSGIDV
jgi:hypothetical protein